MENKQQLQNVLNIAYTLVFSFYTFINVVIFMSLLYTQSAVAGEIYRIAQIPIILLLCFIIFCRFYKRKYIVLMGACLLFALFGYLVTGEKRLLMLLLFAFAAQSISSHKVLKLDFIVRVCSFILVIFLSAEGILANTETIRADGTVRYALGFGHPNYGGIVLFSIFLEWIVLKRKN